METLVLDTNIVSYLMKGHSLAQSYRQHLEGRTLAISFMTVGELYEGAYRRKWGKARMATLADQIKNYLVVPYSRRMCELWGWIRSERKSQPVSVDDAWIAATALTHGCALVTHNPEHFANIEGLRLITEKK